MNSETIGFIAFMFILVVGVTIVIWIIGGLMMRFDDHEEDLPEVGFKFSDAYDIRGRGVPHLDLGRALKSDAFIKKMRKTSAGIINEYRKER